jgi:predicted metal-dependent hydrolase
MGKMVISDIHIDVIKKDIKNMHLAVYPPKGKVRLAVPSDVSNETIKLFTISKLGWIRKQQRKLASQDRQNSRNFVNRETHYFLGKRYLLKVIEEDKPTKVVVKGKSQLELHVRPNTTIIQRNAIMNEWYRMELKRTIPAIITKWEDKMGVSVNSWGVRHMKTKWGTCNIEKKRILLNLELAKIPVRCLEYIIVHEMVHLFERKHNDQFMTYMDKYLANWKALRSELNRLPVSHVDWEY